MAQSYISVSDANSYFQSRLNTRSWDRSSVESKTKALAQATRSIDKLNFSGDKVSSDQPLQFPRTNTFSELNVGTNVFESETTIDAGYPQDILEACCEIALALLDGVDPDKEAQNISIQEHNFGNVRTKRDTTFVQDWILAGIPSVTAWNLLRPYLRDPNEISLSRIN